MSPVDEPWDGPSKIVFGLDFGTTYSAVSYSYLYKGGPRKIISVSKWPDQRHQAGDTKIPTILWYDKDNKPVKCGASALVANALDAQENGWRLVKHFKLNLHPQTMKSGHQLQLAVLPDGIPLNQIYSDFMAYLLKHTRNFFQERVLDGVTVWNHHFDSADLIITHPNGWGIREQSFLRKAAIAAGFPDPEKTDAHIRFVTEAEASVQFCITKADLGSDWLKKGVQFAVCDAGGSTVDITTYEVTNPSPSLQLQETTASACIQAGAIFVDDAAKELISRVLDDPDWRKYAKFDPEDVQDSIRRGLNAFEIEKKAFGVKKELKLDVGSSRLKFESKQLRVRRGELVLDQNTVSSFFDPCLDEIVASVKKQIEGLRVENVLLVGGFGESPYLRQKLMSGVANSKCRVTIANDLTSKAVADGAVLWSMQASVNARAVRFAYGTKIVVPYNSSDLEHRGRAEFRHLDGRIMVRNAWSEVVPRGLVVKTDDKKTEEYQRFFKTSRPALETFTTTLYAFTLPGLATPRFIQDPESVNAIEHLRNGFAEVCTLSADLSGLAGALEKKSGPDGLFWVLEFSISVQFGGVELHAFVEWVENGIARQGNVSIVPNED